MATFRFLLLLIDNFAQVGNLLAAKADLLSATQLEPTDKDVQALQQSIAAVEILDLTPAVSHLARGSLSEALPLLREVIAAAEAVGALSIAAHGYSYMGIALQQQGDISAAITCHERHLRLAEG